MRSVSGPAGILGFSRWGWLSSRPGGGRLRQRWGWSATGDAVVLPSGCVSAAGCRAADDDPSGVGLRPRPGLAKLAAGSSLTPKQVPGTGACSRRARAPAANNTAPPLETGGVLFAEGIRARRRSGGSTLWIGEQVAGRPVAGVVQCHRGGCQEMVFQEAWRGDHSHNRMPCGLRRLAGSSAPSSLAPAARGRAGGDVIPSAFACGSRAVAAASLRMAARAYGGKYRGRSGCRCATWSRGS